MRRPVLQKCIYTRRRTDDTSCYYVAANWAFFRISSKSTESLQEAIDWHIALSHVKEMAKTRMRAHTGEGPPSPMTHEELAQLAQSEPDLQLTFYSNFHTARAHNIFTPTTNDLDLAISMYHRFKELVNANASKQVIAEDRERWRAEIATRSLSRHNVMVQLANMVNERLNRPAIVHPALTRSPAFLPGDFAKRRRLADADAGGARALGPPSKVGGMDLAPPASATAAGGVALGLQVALGLDCAAALRMARHARLMSAAERARRLRAFMAPVPQASRAESPPKELRRRRLSREQLLARAALSDADQHTPLRVGRRRVCEPARAALTDAYQLSPLAESIADRRYRGRPSEEQSPPRQALALSCPEQLQPQARGGDTPPDCGGPTATGTEPTLGPFSITCGNMNAVEATWFLGVAAGTLQSASFTLVEVCRLRATSVDGALASGVEMRFRLKDYCYPSGLAPAPQYTRTGRLLRDTFSHQAVSHRLVNLLTWPGHSTLFESLDLRIASTKEALELPKLVSSLRRMTRLVRIVLPGAGWSCPAARLRFIRALPERTVFAFANLHGIVVQEGVGGPSVKEFNFLAR